MPQLDHALLRDYADTFRTYGDLENDVWFLGLEEGGGRSLEQAAKKICSWDDNGRQNVSYLSGPGAELDPANPFLVAEGNKVKLQKTWSNQLRVLLGIQGEPLSNEAVRNLQATGHGTAGGATCLLELFPLPCKDAGSWIYGNVPFDQQLQANDFVNKKSYYQTYLPRRIEKLKSLLLDYSPDALVCMTWMHRNSLIAMLDSHETLSLDLPKCNGNAIIGMKGNTVVVICSHPAMRFRGPRNRFYHEVGQAIRCKLSTKPS